MQANKKTVLLGVIVFVGAVCALPVMRDELDWRWSRVGDQAVDFMRYYTDWPHGRHVVEAHARYDQRVWADTKKAMIRDAYKENAETNDAYRLERRTRNDRFFWSEAAIVNTIESYRDYLARYPNGQFAGEARSRIATMASARHDSQ